MLIIAIPKSASTSLASSLAAILNKNYVQECKLRTKDNYPEEFRCMAHSDMADIDPERMKKWISSDTIYKQHLAPTEHNLELLRDMVSWNGNRVVVLLRNPRDIIGAYDRVPGGGNVKEWSAGKYTKEETLEDLQRFTERYLNLIDEHEGFLLVNYEELVSNTGPEVNRILSFLRRRGEPIRKVGKNYQLHKKRYTR